VPLPDGTSDRGTLQTLFEQAYHARFHVDLPEIRANLVNLNCSVVGVRPDVDLTALIDGQNRAHTLDDARHGAREVWFEAGWTETPVFWRDHLPGDARIVGPAIIEQMDTTVVIEPGDRAHQDADHNLIIEIGDAS